MGLYCPRSGGHTGSQGYWLESLTLDGSMQWAPSLLIPRCTPTLASTFLLPLIRIFVINYLESLRIIQDILCPQQPQFTHMYTIPFAIKYKVVGDSKRRYLQGGTIQLNVILPSPPPPTPPTTLGGRPELPSPLNVDLLTFKDQGGDSQTLTWPCGQSKYY